MKEITYAELIRQFPNASASTIARHRPPGQSVAGPVGTPRPSPAIVERHPRNATLDAAKTETANTGRVLVRVTSWRSRLLDEDNLCEKYVVDCCRYAGLLSGDDPTQTKIEVRQVKVGKREQEKTVIEIFRLAPGQ